MKKGKYQTAARRKGKLVVFVLAAVVLAAVIAALLLMGRPEKQQAKLPNGEMVQPSGAVEKRADSIAIPGYEGISLKADSKGQEIGFPNPAQNTCYFQISLMLEEPGEISEPITLAEPLAAGVYPNALLKFDCYTMDGTMRALNGAATKMTLHVS